ncbi:MAG: hypothetical protein QOG81_2155, partial [Gaiellaceae bacterium]|nr:hypothetical protein [Gaiellaceae bacterium]
MQGARQSCLEPRGLAARDEARLVAAHAGLLELVLVEGTNPQQQV